MRYRCSNQNNQAYKDYGGRGIKVCQEWQDFSNFREWALANGYTDELTIDRIDVNGDYCPDNCRWASRKTQMNNRRCTPHYDVGDEKLTMSEISQITGIPRSTIMNRIRRGWPLSRAIEKTGGACEVPVPLRWGRAGGRDCQRASIRMKE